MVDVITYKIAAYMVMITYSSQQFKIDIKIDIGVMITWLQLCSFDVWCCGFWKRVYFQECALNWYRSATLKTFGVSRSIYSTFWKYAHSWASCILLHRQRANFDTTLKSVRKWSSWMIKPKQYRPLGTRCNNNIIITSKRRRFDVILMLLLRCVPAGRVQ